MLAWATMPDQYVLDGPARPEAWTRAHAAAMLASTVWALGIERSWPVGVTALVSFAILLARSRAEWAVERRTIVPNLVTALRLLVIVTASIFVSGKPGVLWAALVIGVFALDFLDGWLARRANGVTAFGARFDMETDALVVLVVDVELWMRGQFGVWILTSGLLRYVYVLSVALLPARGGEVPRSSLGRNAFGTLVLGLCVALVSPTTVGTIAAAIGSAAVTLSFVRSFYWSYFVGA